MIREQQSYGIIFSISLTTHLLLLKKNLTPTSHKCPRLSFLTPMFNLKLVRVCLTTPTWPEDWGSGGGRVETSLYSNFPGDHVLNYCAQTHFQLREPQPLPELTRVRTKHWACPNTHFSTFARTFKELLHVKRKSMISICRWWIKKHISEHTRWSS